MFLSMASQSVGNILGFSAVDWFVKDNDTDEEFKAHIREYFVYGAALCLLISIVDLCLYKERPDGELSVVMLHELEPEQEE